MTTIERALIRPELYSLRLDASNDNEPDEGAIVDDRQIQFLYPLECE